MKPADRLYRVLDALALELPAEVHGHARGEIMAAFDAAVFDERAACARLAADTYGDEVAAMGGDEPKAVGLKIARAIRARNPEGV